MREANRGVGIRPNTFGQNLRVARRRKGISQDDLARGSGVDRTAISTYERGRREPNLRTIVRLAQALEIAPAELLRHM
jgi:transcriptional regulator with XRE-family HTH domain